MNIFNCESYKASIVEFHNKNTELEMTIMGLHLSQTMQL